MAFPIQRSIPAINPNSTLINDAYNYLQPKILNISVLARNYMFIGFNTGTAFLLRHKTFVIAGVVIGAALLIIHNYLKNRPQRPIVTIESTANVARLTIHTLTEKPLPVNATLTFCVDLSGSMREYGRAEAVKKAIHDTLNSAEKVVNNGPSDTNIEIAIVGFNDKATVIAKNFKLLRTQENKSNATEIESVKDKINKLIFSGSTEIIAGLTEATSQLESMANRNKKGSHTLILLTDGEESLQEKALISIHEKLASNNATLFAIGIGQKHDKETLTKIVNSKQVSFQGTYIDTTKNETIATAVSKAYTQAISSFNDLVLTAPNLLPGTWSVINTQMQQDKDKSWSALGQLAVGEKLVKIIKIHGDKLPSPLELSSLTFELSYKDPKGRQGTMSLPWNPNTILNPEIVNLAK